MKNILIFAIVTITLSNAAGQGKVKQERRVQRAQEMAALVAKYNATIAEKKALEEQRRAQITEAVDAARAEQEGFVLVRKSEVE